MYNVQVWVLLVVSHPMEWRVSEQPLVPLKLPFFMFLFQWDFFVFFFSFYPALCCIHVFICIIVYCMSVSEWLFKYINIFCCNVLAVSLLTQWIVREYDVSAEQFLVTIVRCYLTITVGWWFWFYHVSTQLRYIMHSLLCMKLYASSYDIIWGHFCFLSSFRFLNSY